MQNSGISNDVVTQLKHRARVLRGHMLRMAKGQGQGYIGQGLGIADLMAALYFHELRYDPQNTAWLERDRFLFRLAIIQLLCGQPWSRPACCGKTNSRHMAMTAAVSI